VKDNRIKELRISKQMKQSDLAKLLNCSPTTVSNYEVGYRDLDSMTICRLCDIFECTADYLLGRSSTGGLQLTPEEENLILALRRADTRAVDMVNVALAPFKQDESSAKADITA
jgi:transcriptional regulator with XRE-family HTH domain